MLTEKYDRALMYTSAVHGGHVRKGTKIPYLSHLMAVSALVLEAGGDEDMAIAALLHDAPEDRGGEERLNDIRVRFGDRVAEIVEKCSDSLDADSNKKKPWIVRKRAYLKHVRESKDCDYLLVTAADKLHNVRTILTDFRTHGDLIWERFLGKPDAQGKFEKSTAEIIGYYEALGDACSQQLGHALPERRAVARELNAVVATLILESKIDSDRKRLDAPQ